MDMFEIIERQYGDIRTLTTTKSVKVIVKKMLQNILIDDRELFITNGLVPNIAYVNWLNSLKKTNHQEGTYTFFNDVNRNNYIKFNEKTKKYYCDLEKEYHPVRGVNWYGALAFALSVGGRLPYVSEWECCATCGYKYLFPWGDDFPTPQYANYDNKYSGTTHIYNYSPNEWGLYDMAGNLREWCMDLISGEKRRVDNISISRYVKGGAWDKSEYHLNPYVTERKWGRIGTMGIGFRVIFDTDIDINN